MKRATYILSVILAIGAAATTIYLLFGSSPFLKAYHTLVSLGPLKEVINWIA